MNRSANWLTAELPTAQVSRLGAASGRPRPITTAQPTGTGPSGPRRCQAYRDRIFLGCRTSHTDRMRTATPATQAFQAWAVRFAKPSAQGERNSNAPSTAALHTGPREKGAASAQRATRARRIPRTHASQEPPWSWEKPRSQGERKTQAPRRRLSHSCQRDHAFILSPLSSARQAAAASPIE